MSSKNSLLLIGILTSLYYLTGMVSFELFAGEKIVNFGVFAPEGIALAFALYFGKRVIAGIFLGQFILAFTNGIDLLPALEISAINSLEALLGIYLFKKFKISKSLKSFKDIVALTLFIVLILQPFSAISSNFALYLHNDSVFDNFFSSVFAWWFGNVMGQLLFTPFLLLLFSNWKHINYKEFLLYGVLFSVYTYTVEVIIVVHSPFLVMSLSVTILLIATAYKSLLYGSFFSVISAIVASYSVYVRIGAFATGTTLNNTIEFNLYVLTQIIVVWIFGLLLEERKNYAKNLEKRIEKEVEKNKEQQLLMLQQNRLAQQGELISMIAHQWRQPLNNLSLLNQLLVSKYYKNKLDDEAIEYFQKNSKKQIELMSRTIDDFRNFFKDEESKKEFSVNDVVEDTIEMIKPITQKNNISITFKAEKNFQVLGFLNNFSQVLLNILNNAKDALSAQEIENKNILITLKQNDNKILLCIEDNAGGIKEDLLDKIFDPYFSTKKEKNGTGLGLYMSKIIIQDQMNGKLFVQNTPNGAKFTISIEGIKYEK